MITIIDVCVRRVLELVNMPMMQSNVTELIHRASFVDVEDVPKVFERFLRLLIASFERNSLQHTVSNVYIQ